jgi:hypothetical protein
MWCMPTATTTVHRTKSRPVSVTATNALGAPLSPSATLASFTNDPLIATLAVDPENNRRYLIGGVNEGTTTVEIGSGPNKLVVTVTVEATAVDPEQINRVDVEAFEDEI